MKVGIIGSGSMGSLYGGVLAEDGHEVWFIDVFKEHLDAVKTNGLIVNKDGSKRIIQNIRATTQAEEAGVVDLAIIFVKSTITDIAVEQNLAVFGPDTIVLTLQNGIGNIEKISQFVSEKQIIAGTSANGANFVQPGEINHAGWGGTTIGELDGSHSERIEKIASMLGTGELGPINISDNVMGLIWDKLLVNVGINPLTALMRLRNGQLLEQDETLHLMEQVVQEGVKVAEAKNIKLGFDDSVAHCKSVADATGANISSMLADVLNGRKTEIDNINGAIVREGHALGIPTPVNEVITHLVKGMEHSKL